MTTRKKTKKSERIPRSDEYKKEAVKLAETVGVTAAARQLGIHTTQIYSWRGKLRVKETRSEAEMRLIVNADLRCPLYGGLRCPLG